jgi:cephalosporin hydroxylase
MKQITQGAVRLVRRIPPARAFYHMIRVPYLSEHTNDRMQYPRCTFLGDTMSQSFTALFMWEKFLSSISFDRIIELGTSNGTLALYFYLFCINRGADFYTFDIAKDYQSSSVKRLVTFDRVFKSHDVLNDTGHITSLIQEKGITIVFCDNGDKPRELEIYGAVMKTGDYIAVHDWNHEVRYRQIKSLLRRHHLAMVHEDLCKKASSHIRIFQRIE